MRLLRVVPELPERDEIRAILGSHFTARNIKAESDYVLRKESKSFERPYGWAWLLKLSEELHGWDDADAKVWSKNLKPLADVIVRALSRVLPQANVSDTNRRAPKHGLWARIRARLCPRRW